ncbi:MAG: response regulator [Polyangia bacterium]
MADEQMGEDKTQLGKILLKRKVVSSKDLDGILDEQKSAGGKGERLASRVLEKGLTDGVELLRALSEQSGVPAVDLEEIEFPLENLEIIPKEIAEEHVILPLKVTDDSINLAMATPDDQKVIDEIEFVTGKKVFPHVSLHAQIVEAVERAYREKESGGTVYRGARFGEAGAAPGTESDAPASTVLPDDSGGEGMMGLDVEIDFDQEEGSAPSSGGLESISAPSVGGAEAVQPAPRPEAEAEGSRGRKILVVDDEDDIRLLISRVLMEKGHQVVTAGRGLEAIQKVQTESPDMIILDAMLPEVHGFDICKKIKDSRKYGHIPVIMISAIYRGWRYAKDLKESYGVDDFIEKPFKIGEFVKKVDAMLKRDGAEVREDGEDLSQQAERILARSVEAYRGGDIDRAIELLRKGLEIDPLAFKLHYNLALLLGKKALSYQAIRELENALELAPSYFPALKNLALLYQKAGFKYKSIETWERALHHCPDEETREGIKRHLMSML